MLKQREKYGKPKKCRLVNKSEIKKVSNNKFLFRS
jgi:hypothetical protein